MAYCVSCDKEVKTGKFCNTCGKQLIGSKAEMSDSISLDAGSDAGTTSGSTVTALWAHLAPLLGAVAGLFTGGLALLLLWLPGLLIRNSLKSTAFDKRHATESMNFQLSLLLYVIILLPVALLTLGLGAFLYIPLGITALVFNIQAIVNANHGREYRYPLTIRFVK